jgi:hypothetical protein
MKRSMPSGKRLAKLRRAARMLAQAILLPCCGAVCTEEDDLPSMLEEIDATASDWLIGEVRGPPRGESAPFPSTWLCHRKLAHLDIAPHILNPQHTTACTCTIAVIRSACASLAHAYTAFTNWLLCSTPAAQVILLALPQPLLVEL